jgi:hypothetical protein
MSAPDGVVSTNTPALTNGALTNGSGAAAILSAGIGCFALAVLAVAADKSAAIKKALIFYLPTGALSGVSTVAILTWLFAWVALELRWGKRTVAAGMVQVAAFVMLALSFLLTFPPIADLF